MSQPHTWVYQMNWHRNAPGARAMHTIDIPFMFDNLAAAPGQIGSTPEELAAAQPLADAMSGMLIHYASTGNPNHPGLAHLAGLRPERAQHDDLGQSAAHRERSARR